MNENSWASGFFQKSLAQGLSYASRGLWVLFASIARIALDELFLPGYIGIKGVIVWPRAQLCQILFLEPRTRQRPYR
jgi:hypothetical protein